MSAAEPGARAVVERAAAVLNRHLMTPYDDGKGGYLFRTATAAELAGALAAANLLAGQSLAAAIDDDLLAQCIADPGSIVGPRRWDDAESVARWGVRALRAVLADTPASPGAGLLATDPAPDAEQSVIENDREFLMRTLSRDQWAAVARIIHAENPAPDADTASATGTSDTAAVVRIAAYIKARDLFYGDEWQYDVIDYGSTDTDAPLLLSDLRAITAALTRGGEEGT